MYKNYIKIIIKLIKYAYPLLHWFSLHVSGSVQLLQLLEH